jgi:hypothetical protein
MHDEDRYTRQRRLHEIGDAGQARIESASVTITGGPGALVEFVYLHRAGVARATLDALSAPPPFPHAAAFRHAAALGHAAGSWRALRSLVELAGARTGTAP